MSTRRGAALALLAAATFGASAPLVKRVAGDLPALVVSGWLYLGCGLAMVVVGAARATPREARLRGRDFGWLAGGIALGGVAAPWLLVLGLARASGTAASLLLNAELVLTLLVAGAAFREAIGPRVVAAALLIALGGGALGFEPAAVTAPAPGLGALFVLLACLSWAIENILTFGPISGAHFNTVVTIADASQGGLPWREAAAYVVAQVLGAIAGVAVANVMFDHPAIFLSHRERHGAGQLVSEFVATFGLLCVIWGCARLRSPAVPFAVGACITAAYWFTASTSFANPAVTLARTLSDTFAGIRPVDVPGFVLAQAAGAGAATLLFRWLVPIPAGATEVLMPIHEGPST